jgi:hypothetical protein
MSSKFKNPILPPKGKDQESPWNYKAPCYDERTSCYIDAGSHYGIGYRNPVGHEGDPKSRVATLPYGRIEFEELSRVPPKLLEQEYIE